MVREWCVVPLSVSAARAGCAALGGDGGGVFFTTGAGGGGGLGLGAKSLCAQLPGAEVVGAGGACGMVKAGIWVRAWGVGRLWSGYGFELPCTCVAVAGAMGVGSGMCWGLLDSATVAEPLA